MSAAKIYKEIDYQTSLVSVIGNDCPFEYPLTTHPNTIFLSGPHIIDFKITRQKVGETQVNFCLHVDAKLSAINAVLSFGQLEKLLQINANNENSEIAQV